MRKTKFCAPYDEKGAVKPTQLYKRLSSTKTGVYIIRRKEDKVILYVGYSQSDLIKTAYRHFQKWTDHNTDLLQTRLNVRFNLF